jgi:hypothetical protein
MAMIRTPSAPIDCGARARARSFPADAADDGHSAVVGGLEVALQSRGFLLGSWHAVAADAAPTLASCSVGTTAEQR